MTASDDSVSVDEQRLATMRRNRKWEWIAFGGSLAAAVILAVNVGIGLARTEPVGWDLLQIVFWIGLCAWKAWDIQNAARVETKTQVRILLDRVYQ